MINGDVLALMEPIPRIKMVGLEEAGSLLSTICTPATWPFSASIRVTDLTLGDVAALQHAGGTRETLAFLLTEGHDDDIVEVL